VVWNLELSDHKSSTAAARDQVCESEVPAGPEQIAALDRSHSTAITGASLATVSAGIRHAQAVLEQSGQGCARG
jgi:hypothetical protein